ncbi:MAG: cyclodeaminase/cyclohydrolase family protein [Chloroflexi bacterium]|nr:cyclodeaminase/cyclohydrolase family protein [Chloroflexota bacterium]
MFSSLTIKEFLTQLGSSRPTPGGGGAAALAGAQAAALVTMVARLTAGKKAFAAIEERIQEVIADGDHRQQELATFIDHDAKAFQAVMAAYALPRATPEQKQSRNLTLQAALKSATETPLSIARHCVAIVRLAGDMAEVGNPHIITDAGTAALLAEAALAGAILQAQINLKAIKDSQYVEQTQVEITFLVMAAREGRERALAAVEKKLS